MKNTKKALLTSVLCLVLCCSMLIGTTFAWFTDEVKSGMNTIVAGNLDVEVYHGDPANKDSIEGVDSLFHVDLWEPGVVAYEQLTVVNEGTLALKYQLSVNFNNEVKVNGYGLSDVLQVAVVDAAALTSREAALAAAKAAEHHTLKSFVLSGKLDADGRDLTDAGTADTYGIVIWWEPSENDNDYNMNNELKGNVLSIDLGIHLYATQLVAEEDSFGPEYDEGAFLPIVYTEAELKEALNANESVQLGGNIALTGEWTPVGDKDAGIYYTGTLDGAGYTISGLTVSSGDYVALISAAKNATIKNLTVEGTVSGKNAAGIVARVEGETVVEDCVSNVTVSGTTKAGGIACNVTGADAKIINCTNNADITWTNESAGGAGGIVGYVNGDAYLEIINCTNTGNVTSEGNTYAGAAVGYANANSTGLVAGFNNTGVITGTVLADGRYLKFGDTVLCGYCGIGKWAYTEVVSTNEQLVNAINNPDVEMITLASGEYGVIDVTIGRKLTIVAAEGATVKLAGVDGQSNNNASDITIKGITIDNSLQTAGWFTGTAQNIKPCVGVWGGNYTFEDCVFYVTGEKGAETGVMSWWTTNAGTMNFKGCTFNGGNTSARAMQIYGNYDLNVEGCTFNTAKDYSIKYVGSEGRTATLKSNVVNATVNFVQTGSAPYAGKDYALVLEGNNLSEGINHVYVDNDENQTITIDGKLYVGTASQLANAVANGATEVNLLPGEYDVYGCAGKTLTINGTNDVVIKLYNDGEDGCDYAFGNGGAGVGNITFNGVTIDTTSNTGNYKGFAYMKGTFNDCNFVGAYSLNNANDFAFNRCTFDFKNGYFWTWAAKSVTFDGCTFNGNSKTILAHGGTSTVININNCTFAATEKGYTGSGDNTAVVEIDPTGSNTYTINFTGDNTKTDSYAGWTRVKDGSTGHTVNGVN